MSSDSPLDLFSQPDPEPARDPEPAGNPEPAEGPGSAGPGGSPPTDLDPEPSGPRIWTVSELNSAVKSLLEEAFPFLWVEGEVGNWTRARSGHCYFTLKDDRGQLQCVMWKGQAARLPMDPEEGMRLRAFGQPTLYENRGAFQLVVRELEGEGEEGLWRLAFERLRLQLQEEGLLDPARKRPLPPFPETIGVVTSPTGAALRDILSVLQRRAPWVHVLLRGTRVQGEGASAEIARAIRVLGGSGRVELLIVSRGGGSIEDLWAFNEEPVARAVAECPVPVISGVGHEVDVTISDLVADLRAPTPSAAAEAAVPDAAAMEEVLATLRPRLARGLRSQVERRSHRLERAGLRLVGGIRRVREPRHHRLERSRERLTPAFRALLDRRRERVERHGRELGRSVRQMVHGRRERLGRAADRVEALSPLSTLRRGYAVPLEEGGRVLRKATEFRVGEAFQLRVVDGRVACRTEEVQMEESKPMARGGEG